MGKDYVFYNKKLGQLFDKVNTEETKELCKEIDQDIMPYKIRPTYLKGLYIVTKNGEPLDEYGYFAKSVDEIKTYTIQDAIDFIDWLKTKGLKNYAKPRQSTSRSVQVFLATYWQSSSNQ